MATAPTERSKLIAARCTHLTLLVDTSELFHALAFPHGFPVPSFYSAQRAACSPSGPFREAGGSQGCHPKERTQNDLRRWANRQPSQRSEVPCNREPSHDGASQRFKAAVGLARTGVPARRMPGKASQPGRSRALPEPLIATVSGTLPDCRGADAPAP